VNNSYFDWKEHVVYAADGPRPQVLLENEKIKVVVAGLEAGQQIPEHPEAVGLYHFLEGEGVMVVDGKRLAVRQGGTVITPPGAVRGMEAKTRLAFLAARVV
jgi:quercetin dioxygenase-like cupin family protein